MGPGASSCRLHAMASLRRVGIGRSKKAEQALSGSWIARCRAHRRRENGRRLQFRWKRADAVDAGQVHQFAQLLEAEVDVAAGDQRSDWNTGRGLDDAGSDGVGDVPALEQAEYVRTARSRRITDAPRAQDGVANRRPGRNVGARRAGRYRYRDAGTCEASAARRDDTAVGRQSLDRIVSQHDKVERFAVLHPPGRIDTAHRKYGDSLP